jgi:4-amino-4-deoxy-L-arabinose transferase-like glycosyltransferase
VKRPSRRIPYTLLAIMLAGLALRLWLWWRVPIHQPANDEWEYLRVARDLVAGRGWVFYEQYRWLRAPLYPLFLAGSLWLAGGDLRWAALPNIMLSTGSIGLWYLLSKGVVPRNATRGHRVGVFAATISAVLLPFATFASLWMSETLWTALFLSALLVVLCWSHRPRLGLAALAGLLFGLAALTRSVPLAAVPLLVIWMVASPRGAALRPRVLGALVCVAVMAGTIAPWTIRNWRAYGGFIAVETGLSYNLWAFNEPRESIGDINRTLEAIPNPVARADYASAKGWERLREDPMIVVRKVLPNWIYLWRVKPIQDRFLQVSYYEDVPFAPFVGALVLDDALYLVVLMSAVVAFVVAPWSRAKTLLGGWLVYVVVVTVLTHGEARYRQLIFPSLIPFAASLWAMPWWNGVGRLRRLVALGAAAVSLLPLQAYPLAWAVQGVRYSATVALGDLAAWSGDDETAIARYDRAARIDESASGASIKTGLLYEQRGDLERAARAYGRARDRNPSYFVATTRLGDVRRRLGDDERASRAFEGYYADQRAISDWGWHNLRSSPAPRVVDVGDGLDVGFVGGMYAPESEGDRRVRWTGADAAIRLAAGEHGTLVQIRLAALRPDNAPVTAQLCVENRCDVIAADARWRTYQLYVPPQCEQNGVCASELELRLFTPTFVPDTQGTDDRQLGLLVDYAAAEPVIDSQRPTTDQ